MPTNIEDDVFYTLDEEKRELVANGIQIGDGFGVYMVISKKYITGDKRDESSTVNIKITELTNISTSLQRKTTRDYIPGQRDAKHFSRGHVIGNGRMVCPVLDRELISFIFGELNKNAPDSKMFDIVETQNTFGAVFEVEEQTEQTITPDRDDLVGGSNIVFSKGREYIYLDDVPVFKLVFLGRADKLANIYKFGESDMSELIPGCIYKRTIERVKFIGSSSGVNAVDPISNEVIDFAIYGNDTGWVELRK